MSQSTNVYPQGNTSFYRKYVLGGLRFIKRSNRAEIFNIDGPSARLNLSGSVSLFNTRRHVTLDQVKAGYTVLPAVPGYQYQIVDCAMVAVGGAAAGATSVNLKGTQSAGVVNLVVNAVGGLTQSTKLPMGEAATSVILADGASFAPCDVNTAITVEDAGPDLTGPTYVDVIVSYALIKA
jgi:hypothetical protein